MSSMSVRGWGVGAVVAALALGAGCGSTGAGSGPVATSTGPSTTSSSPTAPTTGATDVAELTLDQLRQRVLEAVRAESSVRESIGNLNAPAVEVVQDYSEPDGDLEATFSTEPGRPPAIVARRVDGEMYLSVDGKDFEHVPADKVSDAESTPLVALFRTDVVKDLTTAFAAVVAADFDGEDPALGPGVARYRLTADTSRWTRGPDGDQVLGIPGQAHLPQRMPMTLWIGADDLPVRIEAKYSEPLNGIAGTGTVRIDYARWGDAVEVARPAD